ncbi:MAG: class I SAM-dependent methyltransferase [Anaerolineales bacterium]
MTVEIDPEGYEIEALQELVTFDNKHVLEIGCGDGRLTWRYADKPAHVTAIDPDEEEIANALTNCPAHLKDHVDLLASSIEEFAAGSEGSKFDIVIFAWSL